MNKSSYKSKEYPPKAKGVSFFAFLLSIFIYISIFYIFNLSLSTLFKNTKFWFVISNTLILIIAADYGAFSSSKDQHHHLHHEYMMHTQARSTTSSFSQYPEIVDKISPKQLHADHSNIMKTKNDQVQVLGHIQKRKIVQEKRVVHVATDDDLVKNCGRENDGAKTYQRSRSGKAKRVVIDESKNKILRRSETAAEKYELPSTVDEDDNEFSTMSNEELNRRAEEFIQRFNRQIRLQSATARKLPPIM